MLPEPGSRKWDEMVDFMRADLDSGMRYTKIEMVARKIVKEDGRDFDEEFKKWKSEHTMQIICAWCGKDMGNKDCNKNEHHKISHGICTSCKTKMEKEIS